jgi:hypothetical protein
MIWSASYPRRKWYKGRPLERCWARPLRRLYRHHRYREDQSGRRSRLSEFLLISFEHRGKEIVMLFFVFKNLLNIKAVVTSSHGKGFLKQAFLGSVSSAVLQMYQRIFGTERFLGKHQH